MKIKIIPITDLRKTNEITRLAHENEPIYITKNGYSDMVLLSNELYDSLISSHDTSKKEVQIHSPKKIIKQIKTNGFINVAACSLSVKVGDVFSNINEIEKQIENAMNKNIEMICFPELSLTGYTCGDLFYQNELLNHVQKGLKELKEFSKSKKIIFIVGAPFVVEQNLYNCAFIYLDGKILGIVPKQNVPNYQEFYEARYFKPYLGENRMIHFLEEDVPFGNHLIFQNDASLQEIFSCEICEDAWVRHSPSVELTKSGATMIFNLSASNETEYKDRIRRQIVQESSRKNRCAYIYCSSSYEESTTDLLFSGHNIIAELGDVLIESELFEPTMTITTIDVERICSRRILEKENKMNGDIHVDIIHYQRAPLQHKKVMNRYLSPYPFIYSDYSKEEVSYQKILSMQAYALAKRLKSIHCKKVVLGLSGGLDSTLALLVCDRAFDILKYEKKDIVCITMPCFGTSKRTYNNALRCASELGITLIEINIAKAVEQHLKDIAHQEHQYDITFENAQARERTQVLMDYANKNGGIVIGTGDLSEIALGWSTYNGDHMSMYCVNGSLPKTLIQSMITYFASHDYKKIKDVLEDIVSTPISPELLPLEEDEIAQKTEDSIGPYMLHDFFLYHYMLDQYSFAKIYLLAVQVFKAWFDKKKIKETLEIFIKRFFQNQFKRSCMPDGPKVTCLSLSPRGDLRLPSDISIQSMLDEIRQLEI